MRGIDLVSHVTRGALVRRVGRAGSLRSRTMIEAVISVWKIVVSGMVLGMGIEVRSVCVWEKWLQS
jgi:hypothetical protein